MLTDVLWGLIVGAGIALVSMTVAWILMAWYIIKRMEGKENNE